MGSKGSIGLTNSGQFVILSFFQPQRRRDARSIPLRLCASAVIKLQST